MRQINGDCEPSTKLDCGGDQGEMKENFAYLGGDEDTQENGDLKGTEEMQGDFKQSLASSQFSAQEEPCRNVLD